MNIDEKIAELKANIESCERVCEAVPTGSIRDAALRKAEDCKQMAEWLEDYKRLSSSEKPNKWIKVNEEMPIIGQNVLVCDFDGDIYITSLHLNGTWGFDEIGNKIKNIVAWQELPLPYRTESEATE